MNTSHSNNPIAALLLVILFVFMPSIILSAPAIIDPDNIVVLDNKNDKYTLGLHLKILEDKTGSMTVKEAASRRAASRYVQSYVETPSYGFNDLNYWVKFTVKNERDHDQSWFLELDYPHMDTMEVYFENAEGDFVMKKAGDIYPFNTREIDYHNFVFGISILPKQEQTVYMHFSGNCSKQFPLALWSAKGLMEKIKTNQYFLGIYFGIILVMMIFNLFIYFFVRDKTYLYYSIYIGSYGVVQMAYNGLAFQLLWPSLPKWHNMSLPFLIGWTIMFMAIFTQSFLHAKEYTINMYRFMRGIIGVGIAIMIFSLFGNYLIAINSSMVLLTITPIGIMTSAFLCMKRGYRPARFFLAAWFIFMCGLFLISLNKLHFIPVNFITENAPQIGSAIEVTLLSIALADRFNNTEREKSLAQRETIQAQEKYKLLVEGSNDIIFSLDEKLRFITVNNAIRTHLKLNPETLIASNFLDLIYEDAETGFVNQKLVREKLEEFIKTRATVSFNVMFKSAITTEPKEMQARLEHINIEGMNEILGKVTSLEEDVLIPCFERERQKYAITNYLTTADEVTQRITKNLAKKLNQKDITLIRIALREIIINAIEHGNLNICYDEKTDAITNDNYFEFIAERRQDPLYRERRVRIEHQIDSEKAAYKVTDEGDGFEYMKALINDSRDANDQCLPHGRGISMAKNIFDQITYNKKGNEVLLVKKLG